MMRSQFKIQPNHLLVVSMVPLVAAVGCDPEDTSQAGEFGELDQAEVRDVQFDDVEAPDVPTFAPVSYEFEEEDVDDQVPGESMEVDVNLVDRRSGEPEPRAMFNTLLGVSNGYAHFQAWSGTKDGASCTKNEVLFNYAYQVCAYIKGEFAGGYMSSPPQYPCPGNWSRFFYFSCV